MSKRIFLGLSSLIIFLLFICLFFLFLDYRSTVPITLHPNELKLIIVIFISLNITLLFYIRHLFCKLIKEKENHSYYKSRHECSASVLYRVMYQTDYSKNIPAVVNYLVCNTDGNQILDLKSDLQINFSKNLKPEFKKYCTEQISIQEKLIDEQAEKLQGDKNNMIVTKIIAEIQKLQKRIDVLNKIKNEFGN